MIAPVASWPPTAGFYAARLVKGGPRVPIRIWFGLAVIDGEIQDRGFGWRVEINGRADVWEKDDDTGYRCRVALDVQRVWPYCARWPVTPDEYLHLLKVKAWAEEHKPDHPAANVYAPINLKQMQPIW